MTRRTPRGALLCTRAVLGPDVGWTRRSSPVGSRGWDRCPHVQWRCVHSAPVARARRGPRGAHARGHRTVPPPSGSDVVPRPSCLERPCTRARRPARYGMPVRCRARNGRPVGCSSTWPVRCWRSPSLYSPGTRIPTRSACSCPSSPESAGGCRAGRARRLRRRGESRRRSAAAMPGPGPTGPTRPEHRRFCAEVPPAAGVPLRTRGRCPSRTRGHGRPAHGSRTGSRRRGWVDLRPIG